MQEQQQSNEDHGDEKLSQTIADLTPEDKAPQPDRLDVEDLSPQEGELGALHGAACKGQNDCKCKKGCRNDKA